MEYVYANDTNRKYDIIPLLVEIAKSAVKEKVIRVSIATLRVSNRRKRFLSCYSFDLLESCRKGTCSELGCYVGLQVIAFYRKLECS